MVEVKVFSGGSVKTTEVDESRFGEALLGRTLKEAVVMYEANLRAGTHRARNRSEVRGPNRKLWKQKHTGRARMGTKKSPLWRGGGVVFPPRPRDYSYRMPKKARRVALRNAVYTKFRDGEVGVADGWPQDKPSTKEAVAILRSLGMEQSALVVTEALDRNLHLSLRNVPHVDVRPLSDLNARQVLLRRHMVLTPGALKAMEEALGREPKAGSAEAQPEKAPAKKASAKKTAKKATTKKTTKKATKKATKKTAAKKAPAKKPPAEDKGGED